MPCVLNRILECVLHSDEYFRVKNAHLPTPKVYVQSLAGIPLYKHATSPMELEQSAGRWSFTLKGERAPAAVEPSPAATPCRHLKGGKCGIQYY